jgi:acyl-CoA thioester hydrolase
MTASAFAVSRDVTTRWADTDIYGHINNAAYVQLFDTAINGWIIEETGFDPAVAPVIGVVAHYSCTYHRELRFPQALNVGLRIAKIGRSSVAYELGLLAEPGPDGGLPQMAAEAQWVHVYIDRSSRRPVGIPADIRAVLQTHAGLQGPVSGAK